MTDSSHQQIREGQGWRLGWRPHAAVYPGLVAGDVWAFEVTAAELADLQRLAAELADTMTQMADLLMDEERLTCEAESELIWLEADGFPTGYSLRFILLSGRGAEGGWPETVVPKLLSALARISSFDG